MAGFGFRLIRQTARYFPFYFYFVIGLPTETQTRTDFQFRTNAIRPKISFFQRDSLSPTLTSPPRANGATPPNF